MGPSGVGVSLDGELETHKPICREIWHQFEGGLLSKLWEEAIARSVTQKPWRGYVRGEHLLGMWNLYE
jgi:hypothetical protein